MYVGNLRAHKNVVVVLDAMTRVPSSHLRMLIPCARAFGRAASVRGTRINQIRVMLLSGIDDDALASHYRGAAATVMPSTLEGFGLPALESIMTGTPVLYWQGCAAVAETVGRRGHAVKRAYNFEEWSALIDDALTEPQRVDPPTGAYEWDVTAAAIDEVLNTRA